MNHGHMDDGASPTSDPFEPGFVAWPYPQYDRLRVADPVHWSPLLEGRVLTRCADVAAVLRDPNVSVELERATPTPVVARQLERQELLGAGDGVRTIAAGDVIYPGVAAANRDPARWSGPDRVVIDRPDAAQHLQFGGGVHHCLGNHLGRLMAEVALGALVRRLDGVTLDGEPSWGDRLVLRGLQRLPITYRAARSPG
jgi:cytochrome P450